MSENTEFFLYENARIFYYIELLVAPGAKLRLFFHDISRLQKSVVPMLDLV